MSSRKKRIQSFVSYATVLFCFAWSGCKQDKPATQFPVKSSLGMTQSSGMNFVVQQKPIEQKPGTTTPTSTPSTVATGGEYLKDNAILKNAFEKYGQAQIDSKFDSGKAIDYLDDPYDSKVEDMLITQFITILETTNSNFYRKKENENAYVLNKRFDDVFAMYVASPVFQAKVSEKVKDSPVYIALSAEEKKIADPILYALKIANLIYPSLKTLQQFDVYTSQTSDNKTLRTMILGRVDYSPGSKNKKAPNEEDQKNLLMVLGVWKSFLDSAAKPADLAMKITGHGDRDGNPSDRVSKQRAESIIKMVQSTDGLNVFSEMIQKFTPVSMSDTYPLIATDPKDTKNRRAEIVITQKEYKVQNMGRIVQHDH